MPYLILIIGLLVGGLATYIWFLNSETRQIKYAVRAVALTFYALILIFFAVTGRIIISIVLLVVAFPFLLAYLREKNAPPQDKQDNSQDIKIIDAEEITEDDEQCAKNDEKEDN